MDKISKSNKSLDSKKHVKYLQRCLDILPSRLSSLDMSRLTIAFFAISGLDILDSLHLIKPIQEALIKWIYSLQVLPGKKDDHKGRCGFRGSSANGVLTKYEGVQDTDLINRHDSGHIAMTYTGLAILVILEDNLLQIDKEAIISSLIKLQQPDGSFRPLPDDSENDMRFVYCASNISYILNDWGGMNQDKTVEYIRNSMSYEGGIGQGPGLEAHGGSTYCAIASLVLMNRLESTFNPSQLRKIRTWCLFRQKNGFQGRPNKPPDTCYSFWVGATLKLLDVYSQVNYDQNKDFILSTQDPITGGLSKYPNVIPDPMHTYLGLAGLSLMEFPEMQKINPALNMSQRAVDYLNLFHKSFKR